MTIEAPHRPRRVASEKIGSLTGRRVWQGVSAEGWIFAAAGLGSGRTLEAWNVPGGGGRTAGHPPYSPLE